MRYLALNDSKAPAAVPARPTGRAGVRSMDTMDQMGYTVWGTVGKTLACKELTA